MSTRKTIGGAPGFGGAGNKGMLALLRVDELGGSGAVEGTTAPTNDSRTTHSVGTRRGDRAPFAARCVAAASRMARDERRGDDPRRRAPAAPPDLSSPGTRGRRRRLRRGRGISPRGANVRGPVRVPRAPGDRVRRRAGRGPRVVSTRDRAQGHGAREGVPGIRRAHGQSRGDDRRGRRNGRRVGGVSVRAARGRS